MSTPFLSLFSDFSGVDIVAVAIGVQTLCGLVGEICELFHKPADVPFSGSGIQAVDCQPAIIVDSCHNSGIGLKSNAVFRLVDTAICVGMRIEFFHLDQFLSFFVSSL